MPRPTFVAAAVAPSIDDTSLAFDPGAADFVVFGCASGTSPLWRGVGTELTVRLTEVIASFFNSPASLITTPTPGSGSGAYTLTGPAGLSALSLAGVESVDAVGFIDIPDANTTETTLTVPCGPDQLIVWWALVANNPAAVNGNGNTVIRASSNAAAEREIHIGTSTEDVSIGGWAATFTGRHIQWVRLNGIPGTTQVLRPDATVENTDWTPNTGTAHGDTSDESDTSFIEATADAASVTLALANPSPPFASLSGAVLTVRARIAP